MVERVTVPAEEGLTGTPVKPTDPDNAGQTVESVVGRPEWLPENFKSVSDFLESHKELRADHSRKAQELAELKKPKPDAQDVQAEDLEAKSVTDGKVPDGDVSEDLEANAKKAASGEAVLPGLENDVVQEISDYAWQNGELTEEHYATLEKAGYSKQIVDAYVSGQMAATQNATAALIESGGGPEAVQSMFDWAQESLSEAEVQNYNSKFAQGGHDATMAMEHLRSRFENSGVAPAGRPVTGGAVMPSGNSSIYQSVAQVQADMSDPRYKVDPAFRREVEQKLGRSNVL